MSSDEVNPDELKRAWRSHNAAQQPLDAQQLLEKFRRDEERFAATIFWRDRREVGISLVLIPVWIVMGINGRLLWTWYLVVPGLLWIAVFMLVDRKRHPTRPPSPAEPLRRCVEISIAQVEHQIWLLRNVFWWYLLPIALPLAAFFGHGVWQQRPAGPLLIVAVIPFAILAAAIGGLYGLNQFAVRNNLVPRRQQLQSLLASLRDEPIGS